MSLFKICAASMGVVFLIVTITGCKEKKVEPKAVARPVQYQQVEKQSGQRRLTFSGTVKAQFEKDLSFKVSGTVIERPVSVGDPVNTDQLLARLDPRDYRVAVREADAELSSAQAELRNAEANYERVIGLYENRNASKSELDAARAGSESASAHVRVAQEKRKGARLQLSYTEIKSPKDCSIAETYVNENENVTAGQAIVQVNCGDCSEVTVSVPETVISHVKGGSQVKVTVDAFPDQTFPALITEVGVASGTAGTTYPVRVLLTGDCPKLRSGMAADVKFTFGKATAPEEIKVPFVSVGEDREGHFVFVLEKQGENQWIARRRSVTIGKTAQEGLTIIDGLKEGERIATAGVRRIQDGLEVKLLDLQEDK
jgi:multidrug efflux system membrane fusion protein